MNEADLKVKQQIIEKIKNSTNILIVVSKDPSVDALSASLGLTALLNKINKHPTAIFSGILPPAIAFLDPGKVFENSVDSLRDFIIALDKEKADHLRYKVEGDVVKIFITPYRTTITSDDLEFSQGDFNVELVLALGVSDQENLDNALAAHGEVLHDITVATLTSGTQTSQLGALDWHDTNASSLSEMVVDLGQAFATGKDAGKTLLDKQIATALLTGIVAATDRFSNVHTTSESLTIAAQLMAAGADQQLIAARLQDAHEINALPPTPPPAQPTVDALVPPTEPVKQQAPDGTLTIAHEAKEISQNAPTEDVMPSLVSNPIPNRAVPTVEEVLASQAPASPEPVVSAPVSEPVSAPIPSVARSEQPLAATATGALPSSAIEPSLGGTLNATTEEAAEEARREAESQQNKTILTHAYLGGDDRSFDKSANEIESDENYNENKNVDIFDDAPMSTLPPDGTEMAVNLPMPPPVPDFSTLPPASMPDYTPPTQPTQTDTGASNLPPSNDPGQFKIPN